jgi:hypothetical protein
VLKYFLASRQTVINSVVSEIQSAVLATVTPKQYGDLFVFEELLYYANTLLQSGLFVGAARPTTLTPFLQMMYL